MMGGFSDQQAGCPSSGTGSSGPPDDGRMLVSQQDLDEEFVVWLREHTTELLAYGRMFAGRSMGEDMAQEAAIKIYKAWSDPAKREKCKSTPVYVQRIVKNAYLDYRKVRSRTNELETELPEEPVGDVWVARSDDVELSWELTDALLELSDEERTLIFYRYYRGMKIGAAGRMLGLSASRSSELHKRALAQLRQLVSKEEDNGGR
jgi:RNA polymerase sigma factor (sigma-70 family)